MHEPLATFVWRQSPRPSLPPHLDPSPHPAAPPIVCVAGARAGVGTSTLARLLALGMQRRLDLFRCTRRVAVLDLASCPSRLGVASIGSYLASAQRVAPAVVLDVPAGAGPFTRELVRLASHLVLVTDLSPESLAATVVAAQTLGIVHPEMPSWIVVNRSQERAGRTAFAAVDASVLELAAAAAEPGRPRRRTSMLRYAGALPDDSGVAGESSWPPNPFTSCTPAPAEVVRRLSALLLETPS